MGRKSPNKTPTGKRPKLAPSGKRKPSRVDQVREVADEYASDLREFKKKFRNSLN